MKHYITKEEFEKVKEIVLKEISLHDYNTPYEFILDWIEAHCQNRIWSDKKSSRAPRYTSYGLKHSIENDYPYYDKEHSFYTHGYCANNWVKCALFDLGYDIKDTEENIITYDSMLENGVNYYYRKL